MPVPETFIDDDHCEDFDPSALRDPSAFRPCEVEQIENDADEPLDLPLVRELMGWLRAEERSL